MSTRLLVAIIDTKTADLVGAIAIFRRPEPAIRMFKEAAMDKEANPVSQHTADVELWQLGTIDDDSMVITSDKQLLYSGKEFLAEMKAAQQGNS